MTDPTNSPERASKGPNDGGAYGAHVNAAYKLCMSRHKRYGSSNIESAGIVGIVVRLGDKLSRMRQFINDGGVTLETTPEEAQLIFTELCGGEENKFEDDLLDVINYAVIARMWLNCEWGAAPTSMYGRAYTMKKEVSE